LQQKVDVVKLRPFSKFSNQLVEDLRSNHRTRLIMKKIAIIGFGFMGQMHAQIYDKLSDSTLVAIVDQETETAQENLKKHGLNLPVYNSLAALLATEDVDAIDLCLPTDLHASVALAVIAAGKHLFCEKPLALSVEDSQRITTAAEEAGIIMQVGQCIRFWPEYLALIDFVRSERAGKLLSLSLQRRAARPAYSNSNWLNNPERSCGAAFDLHIHDTDFVQHLLGVPRAVTSVGSKDAAGWSHIFTTYHFDGIAVVAEGGWNYPAKWGFQMAFQAVFENGTVEYDSGAHPTLVATIGDQVKAAIPYSDPGAGTSSETGGNLSALGGYYNELEYFVQCLNSGRHPETATARQALTSVRITLAEIESASTGQTVIL
jgi:predicted dehydrogenase